MCAVCAFPRGSAPGPVRKVLWERGARLGQRGSLGAPVREPPALAPAAPRKRRRVPAAFRLRKDPRSQTQLHKPRASGSERSMISGRSVGAFTR